LRLAVFEQQGRGLLLYSKESLLSLDPQLSVESTFVPARVVVTVRGELDVATVPQLRASLAELIDERALVWLIVDVRGLTFIDSAGVHALVEVSKTLRRRGGELALSGVTTGAFKVLDVCGLANVLLQPEARLGGQM
jgi:anti-sigma B factor antagonist